MASRKTVEIKELKNKLSAYVRDVRRGDHILVSDRGEIVAELHAPGSKYLAPENSNPVLAAWARAGLVTLASRPKTPLRRSPLRSPKGTAARYLNAGRKDKGR